jgi:peptidoglycan/LPS O-acetylase OafA/YrhL
MAMSRSVSGGYIPTLDGWRCISIVGVMIAHGGNSVLQLFGIYSTLPGYGAIGVDIFFAISGFLICSRLIQEQNRFGRISLKGFYIRRAFRILPPYFLCLSGIALLAAAGLILVHRWEWLGCLFFFRNYVPAQLGGWYTGHFWSLAVEEHFYLIWPGLLVLWGLPRARRWVPVLALAIAVWRALEYRLELGTHVIPGLGFFTRTDIRFDALLWGCWAALVFPELRERARWFRPAIWACLVGAFAFCVVFKPPFAFCWQSALAPLMLVGTILYPESWAGRILETAPMRWIGTISYSLYLWQQVFLIGEKDVPHSLGILQSFPLNVVAVFACASFSYYLVERPLIKIGYRIDKAFHAGRAKTLVLSGNAASSL